MNKIKFDTATDSATLIYKDGCWNRIDGLWKLVFMIKSLFREADPTTDGKDCWKESVYKEEKRNPSGMVYSAGAKSYRFDPDLI